MAQAKDFATIMRRPSLGAAGPIADHGGWARGQPVTRGTSGDLLSRASPAATTGRAAPPNGSFCDEVSNIGALVDSLGVDLHTEVIATENADRAERFEDYREKRTGDAERAREAVSAIADNIPLGQPILVGHHSERHARKDAEKIENGMRRCFRNG